MAKLTAKQEQFSHLLANGMSQTDAYKNAYNAESMSEQVIWNEASKLANHHEVSIRVSEIQADIRKELKVTAESITKELEEARMVAAAKEQGAAMVSASMGKAKLHGLLVDNVVVKDELRDKVRAIAESQDANEAAQRYADSLKEL